MKFSDKNLIQSKSIWLKIGTFCLLVSVGSVVSAGTLVRVGTSIGHYHMELLDDTAPITVANFLGYVERGDYNQTYIHRIAEDPFTGDSVAVQGGAYRFQPFVGPITVPTQDPIPNEFIGTSNVRGTVSMAKRAGDLDSGTNQWFVNLVDNSDVWDRSIRVAYIDLEENETASASFSGDITVSATTIELLVEAINNNEVLSTQWSATLFNDILLLSDVLDGSLPVNDLIAAEITGGDGGETTITSDSDFTVFATVVSGMNVVDGMAILPNVTLGTGPWSDNTPVGTPTYSDPSNFVYQNVEVVEQVSEATNFYDGATQKLFASIEVEGTDLAFGVIFKLVVESGAVMFQAIPESIIQLHFTPQDTGMFSGDDLWIRLPEIEVYNGVGVEVVENVTLLFTDFQNLGFTLVSTCQGC